MVSFRGTYWFYSAYFILLRACRFFLFLSFFLFFVESTSCRYIEVSSPILPINSGVVPRFLSGILRGGFLQHYLVINVTGLIPLGKNLSYILSPLAS